MADPLPTITGLVKAASNALRAEGSIVADTRSGSIYNHAAGPMAVLFAREADRDEDLFRDIYFDSATGWPLTNRGAVQFGIARNLASYGLGTVTFARTSAAVGGGTFLQGMRIQVASAAGTLTYQVAQDTQVSAAAVLASVPVQACTLGSGTSANATGGLTLLDSAYDPLWLPTTLKCAAGKDFEKAADYRARVRSTLLAARNGYLASIVTACQNAGATYVLAFPSYYGLAADDFDDDLGLNAIYVADASFGSSPALTANCQVALEGCRVGGADCWVGGIVNTPLTVNALVSLNDQPSKLPTASILRSCVQALLAYFGPTGGGYAYRTGAMRAAIAASSPHIQTAGIPLAWMAGTGYALGDLVFDPAERVVAGGQNTIYQCASGGQSGSSAPVWQSPAGAVTVDGSVEWSLLSLQSLGVYIGGNGQGLDPTLSPAAWPAALPRYTLAPSAITLTLTGPL